MPVVEMAIGVVALFYAASGMYIIVRTAGKAGELDQPILVAAGLFLIAAAIAFK